jgi:hypothetical protein
MLDAVREEGRRTASAALGASPEFVDAITES